jgi:hypothetical protein
MITVEVNFLENLFVLVSEMFADLAPVEMGIFMLLIFGFVVRMLFDWIKRIRYV